MTSREKVLSVYPDAKLSSAFAMQPDGCKRWMWCAMSTHKARKSRGKSSVENIGKWGFSEAEAWDDAASKLPSAPSPAGETASARFKPKDFPCPRCAVSRGEDCIDDGTLHGRHFHVSRRAMADDVNLSTPVPEPVSTEGAAWYECSKCEAGISSKRKGLQRCITGGYCDPAAPIAPAAVSGLTYDDCSLADAQVAEQWAVAYVCKVGVSRETMIDALSTLRALVVTYERAKPSAEGDGWIAELRYGLKLVEHALADENVEHVAPWTRMRNWLNQRDIYNGDLQEHRVTLEVVKKLLTLLPAPPSGQGEVR